MNLCLNCGKETGNPKFCSRNCSASYGNRKSPKRKSTHTKICSICGNKKHYQSKICKRCFTRKEWDKASESAIKDYVLDGFASSEKYNRIREWAKKIIKASGKEKKCEICGFDIEVEVCHKKPISSFGKDSLLKDVNSLENLIYLCPNHHIMLDKGLLKL